MPRHINPKTDQKNRTAIAPYNFIPLPNKIYTVDAKTLPKHDHFEEGSYSGYIDLKIKTLTPLFIRGPVVRNNGEWDSRESRLRPEPFKAPDGKPMIPGSSLRGMVRNLLEILSFSKIQPVTDEKPFFRDMTKGHASEYRKHFIEEKGEISSGIDVENDTRTNIQAVAYRSRVRAGFVEKDGSGWRIHECGLARVEQSLIKKALDVPSVMDGRGPNATPSWNVQHKHIFAKADAEPQNYFFRKNNRHPNLYLNFRKASAIKTQAENGYQRGLLVITGGIPNKHFEFVFLPDEKGDTIPIQDELWERFHSEDQLSQWQEKAFPKDKPDVNCRKKGWLKEGEPVFFLTDDNNNLLFFGRAQMFRFPYDHSPVDLIPDVKSEDIDLAEAIFGKVPSGVGDKSRAIKGRVIFEDAFAHSSGQNWFEDKLVPQILSSPKITCYPHYLTQDGEKELKTYIQGDRTSVRGHKHYWHRWDNQHNLALVKEDSKKHNDLLIDLECESPNDSQHTIIKPVKPGVNFSGRVRFENLTDIELGALIAALKLPENCAYKIGMAKPLGLGSIRIEPTLSVFNRRKRYGSWEEDGVSANVSDKSSQTFVNAMVEHSNTSGETIMEGNIGLRCIARLDALFHILEWVNRPPCSETRYMVITDGDAERFSTNKQGNEYSGKPVLPTPHRVVGRQEPKWPQDPTVPKLSPSPSSKSPASKSPVKKKTDPPPPAKKRPTPIQKGQTIVGNLKKTGDKWIVKFEGDERDAKIENPEKIPAKTIDDAKAEFYIVLQNKNKGIIARFEKLL